MRKVVKGNKPTPTPGQTLLTNFFTKGPLTDKEDDYNKKPQAATPHPPPAAKPHPPPAAKPHPPPAAKPVGKQRKSLKLGKRKVAKGRTTPTKDKPKQRRIDQYTPTKSETPTKLAYVLERDHVTRDHVTIANGDIQSKRNLFDNTSITKEMEFESNFEDINSKEEEEEEEMDYDTLLKDLPVDWDDNGSHDGHMMDDQLTADDESDHVLPMKYKVRDVEWQTYNDENYPKRSKTQIVLQLVSYNGREAVCYLRDDWIQTDIRFGDTLHIVNSCSSLTSPDHTPPMDQYIVSNNTGGCVIINPDHLVTSTSIANGVTCTRRAVLSEMFKGQSQHSEVMLLGKLLHELFQKVLIGEPNRVTNEYVQSLIPDIVSNVNVLEQLYILCLSEKHVEEQLEEYVPLITKWCNEYQNNNDGECKIEWKRTSNGASDIELMDVRVNEVVDIEENIWCPRFGLKGKIDATFRIKVGPAGEEFLLPFELKTGQMVGKYGLTQHRAQVVLYCLMLCDSHSTPVPAGLLHYLKTDKTLTVFAPNNETRALLIARNHLARYHDNHWDHVTLPEMLKDAKTCRYCPLVSQCALHHKCFENGTLESSGLKEWYPPSLDHMTSSWVEFYQRWYFLAMEEMSFQQIKELREKIWRKSTRERVQSGTCISNLLPCQPEVREQEFYQVKQSFKRQDTEMNFHTLAVNDKVFVSRLDGRGWAVAMGYVLSLSSESLILALDKAVSCDVLYCIDTSNYVHGDISLSALATVCSSDSERDHQLRELVIDLKPPKFIPDVVFTSSEEELMRSLNVDQKNAIRNVLSCKDYSLILGMPGTGKTTTIKCLIQLLVARKQTVLLTSFTNSAVDNVLVKLIDTGIDFIRIGSSTKVHPMIANYTVHQLTKSCKTVDQLRNVYHSKSLVATTCHALDHSLLAQKHFDYCLMDEASQILLPLSLAPLRLASHFVLVGDHYQLPPLVQSPVAKEGGYDISLFKRLSESHPAALTSLTCQHRMNRDIMELSNRLIYNNVLRCASDDVATATMQIPDAEWESKVEPDWLKRTVDPKRSVVFLNTDTYGLELEERNSDQICNSFEVDKVIEIVQALTQLGVSPCDILVITQYRHQQKLIQKQLYELANGSTCLKSHSQSGTDSCSSWNETVEVLTVDKCQGKDKSCVIMSLVRSNKSGKVGNLLMNWQRINVSLTRAKHKLIFVGSCKTLTNSPYVDKLVSLVRDKQWTIDMS